MLPLKPYEKDYNVQMDITVEMNLNQVIIARDGYTYLDFLSDIGGMQGMLISLIALFIGFWNYNHLENYMVSNLFLYESGIDDKSRGMKQDKYS